MTRKQKKMLWRILISFVLFTAALLLPTIWLSGPIPLLSVIQDQGGCGAYALAKWPLFLIPYLGCALESRPQHHERAGL